MTSIDTFDRTETGRALGHDLFRFSRLPLQDTWPEAVREGFREARADRSAREAPDRYVKKWLQLRLSAWQRHRIVDPSVDAALLRLIDVDRCPITRVALTHAELHGSDASVDRINNDGAYAANNLAVMSTRANAAKGARSFDEVLELSRRSGDTDGLSATEWLRLAVVMLGPCFATNPKAAPLLPLAAPIPSRSARPASQQVQHVFMQGARRPSGKNALIKHFSAASVSDRSTASLRNFAEAMHAGLKDVDEACDAWLHARVMQTFVDWWRPLDDTERARAGAISRCMLSSVVVPPSRLSTWHLESRGRM